MPGMRVIGLGAGGHAKGLVEILVGMGYETASLLDAKKELVGSKHMGIPVLGDENLLPELAASGVEYFFIGVGTNSENRKRLFNLGCSYGLKPLSLIHRSAIISPSANVGFGLSALALSVINADVRIGSNVIVNTGAIVEHDCIIENHVHIAPGACLCGGVRVGEGALVGARATVLRGVTIGKEGIVGAGSVVTRNVAPLSVAVGIPAKYRGRELANGI